MNMWMTCLALAGMGGVLGASAFAAVGTLAPNPLLAYAPVRSDASAIFPTPTPHSLKKCRRVMPSAFAAAALFMRSMTSILGYSFVEIQHRPGRGRPRRPFYRVIPRSARDLRGVEFFRRK